MPLSRARRLLLLSITAVTAAGVAVVAVPTAGVAAAGGAARSSATIGPAITAAIAAPYTVMALNDADGSVLPHGGYAAFTPATSDLSMSSDLTFSATESGGVADAVTVTLTPPTGGDFTVGNFTTASPVDSNHPGLTVTSTGSCVSAGGTLKVLQIDRDSSTNDIVDFAADFSDDNCGSQVSGVIRWNSSIDYVSAAVPAPVSLGTVYENTATATGTMTVTNNGSEPLVVSGSATWSDDSIFASFFTITSDSCANSTVAVGSSCAVQIKATPEALGSVGAILVVPDNAPGGHNRALISVTSQDQAVGTYYPLAAARILDTRNGTGASKKQVAGGSAIHLQVSGKGGVPTSGVSAVVLNVTTTRETSGGYVTVWPTGKTRPTVSNINYSAAVSTPNSVTVGLGTGGKVDLYNSAGKTDLIADVIGWYASSNSVIASHHVGGSYQPLGAPIEIFSTLADPTQGIDDVPMAKDELDTIGLDFDGTGIASNDVTALAVTVIGLNATAGGYLTAFDQDSGGLISTVNVRPGATSSNITIAKARAIGTAAAIDVYNGSSKPVDVIVNVDGFYTDDNVADGLRFHPLSSPVRIVDTRSSLGGVSRLGGNTVNAFIAPASVTDDDTYALATNVTSVKPSKDTWLKLWPHDSSVDPGLAGRLYVTKGVTVAGGVLVPIASDFGFNIYNRYGSTDVLVDVSGHFDAFPPGQAPDVVPALAGGHAAPRALAVRR